MRPVGMLFTLILLPHLVLLPTLARAADPIGNPVAGEARFMRVGCYECHGTVGQGGIAGMRIVPMPLPWLGFQVYVRRPGGQMPAFSDKVLSDAELADIYAFLTGLPAGRGAAEIPLLHDTLWLASSPAVAGPDASPVTQGGQIPAASLKNGQEVYVAVCASCHDSGVAGAPKIGDKAAWAARLPEGMGLLYLHSLKGYHGKAGVMPARGGRADLPVELVKQSVDYMVSRSN